jgi:hypothetical protein
MFLLCSRRVKRDHGLVGQHRPTAPIFAEHELPDTVTWIALL